jgi:outer membrane protein assembly factor BamB
LIGSSGGLFALNRADGTVHWRFSGQDLIYTPVIDKTGNVKHAIAYAASRDGMLRAINTGDGSLLWQRSFPGWIYTPALSGGTLVTGGSASKLWGIDSETGAIRWQRELPGELVTAPLTSANDRIIVTTFSGDLLMLRARDGEIIWQHQLTTVAIHISANDKRIFSSGYDGVVHAMDAITGTRLWQHDTHGDRHQRLQITRAGLLVINERGLQQLDLHDGSMLARRDIDGEPIGSAQQIAGEYWIFYRQGRNPQPVRISF